VGGDTTGHRKGIDAERLAAWLFRLKGYRVLAARYKTPVGEVDLVLRRGRTIVFAEVKLRATARDAAEAVHAVNRARVRRAAELYLQRHPRYTGFGVRFDAVVMAPGRWPRHIADAF
jgi:putative endonuclease